MSLFRSERPDVARIKFMPQVMPVIYTASGAGTTSPTEGDMWYDAVTRTFEGVTGEGLISFSQGTSSPLVTGAVTNTNPTSATALMTYAFGAGSLNLAGKTVHIYGAGEYTTDSGTGRTITIAVTLGDGTNTRTLLTWTSGATTASQTNLPWNIDGNIVIQAVGTAGTAFAHGTARVTLGTSAGGSTTSYNDTNTAVSSALNFTVADTLTVTALFSGSNAANTITEDMLIVSVV